MSHEQEPVIKSRVDKWIIDVVDDIKESGRFHVAGIFGGTLNQSRTPDTIERLVLLAPENAFFELDTLNQQLEDLSVLTRLPINRRFETQGTYLVHFGSLFDERIIGEQHTTHTVHFRTDLDEASLAKTGVNTHSSINNSVLLVKESLTLRMLPDPKIADMLAEDLTSNGRDFRLRALSGIATVGEFDAMRDYNRAYRNLFLLKR